MLLLDVEAAFASLQSSPSPRTTVRLSIDEHAQNDTSTTYCWAQIMLSSTMQKLTASVLISKELRLLGSTVSALETVALAAQSANKDTNYTNC